MKHRAFFLFCISWSLLICACAGSTAPEEAPQPPQPAKEAPPQPQPAGLDPQLLRSGISGQQLGSASGATWIDDSDAFRAILAKLDRSAIKEGAKTIPAIDFARQGALLVWMGSKPSGGYAIALVAEKSLIRGDTAFVSVNWTEPAKGAMVPQMRTAPYLMVRLNKGGYNRIAVIDQQERSRMALNINRK